MVYKVYCKEYSSAQPSTILVEARNRFEAYDKAVYEVCDYSPYSAWVDSVRYSNGKVKRFNTFEGKPY